MSTEYKNIAERNAIQNGHNCIVSVRSKIAENVTIGHNCIIEDDVIIGENCYIDSNSIIRKGVTLGANSFVGSNCILGEYWMDFCIDRKYHEHQLKIGDNALIRSGSIVYAGSEIGNDFQTGHRVTIREKASIGNHVSIGTLSDVQGNCRIGNYVRLHSNVHISQLSIIDDFVWIFPYVVLTNDPTPPSDTMLGVHINSFAIIATSALILPGIEIGQDSLVAGGAVVTKPVLPYSVVAGNPAKMITDVRNIKNKYTGKPAYPWRNYFKRSTPWSDSEFNKWYSSLSLEGKKFHGINDLI